MMNLSLRMSMLVGLVSVALLSQSGLALAASSWLNQPSWATGASPSNGSASSSNSSGSSSYRSSSRDYRSKITPFSPGSNNASLDVGQVFLMGDLGSRYSDAIGIRGHYTYGVSDLFGFDSSLGYSSHSDGSLSMTTLLTGMRMNLSWYDKVIPYAVFGMGFYRPSFEVTTQRNGDPTSISPLLFGVHMGPGVNLELTQELYFGAALTFHNVFGSSQQVAANEKPIEVGGTFTSFLVSAGMTF